jgi:hypothetical protein
MAQVSETMDILAAPSEVWSLVGGFDTPLGLKSFGAELADGGRVRSYSYAIVDSPFAVADDTARLWVDEAPGEGSRVPWSAAFAPARASTEAAEQMDRGIFADTLQTLAAQFTA